MFRYGHAKHLEKCESLSSIIYNKDFKMNVPIDVYLGISELLKSVTILIMKKDIKI